MKTSCYRLLYRLFLFLSTHFDCRFLKRYKWLAASGLLACAGGCHGQAPVAASPLSEEISPAENEQVAVGESSLRTGRVDTVPKEEEPNIFCYVKEEMPLFPGGDAELLKFIRSHLVYPPEMRQSGLEGRVIVSMTIDKEGYVGSPEVLRGVHPLLDSAAVAVIRQLPRWKPGQVSGKPVAVKYAIPVTFRLDSADRVKTEK